jgi:hypothetical protein
MATNDNRINIGSDTKLNIVEVEKQKTVEKEKQKSVEKVEKVEESLSLERRLEDEEDIQCEKTLQSLI